MSYYPVYPSSYWNYVDNFGDESTVSVSDDYVLHSYEVGEGSGIMSEEKYVPIVSGKGGIYGYSVFYGDLRPFFSKTYDEVLDYTLYQSGHPFPVYFAEHISNVDTTVVINDVSYFPTIEVESYIEGNLKKITYYTKDVGIIIEVKCPSGDCTPTSLTEVALVSYFVNN